MRLPSRSPFKRQIRSAYPESDRRPGVRSLPVLALAAAVLLAGCLRQVDPQDGDGDGLPDNFEAQSRQACYTTVAGVQECVDFTSDATKADTDGDGLDDAQETGFGTSAGDADTDNDGLIDGPDLPIGSADGLKTAGENLILVDGVYLGERSQCNGQGTKGNKADSDLIEADGISDGDEVRGWNVTIRGVTQRVTSNPCSADTDSDLLNDGEEKSVGSNPMLPDSDEDGARDGVDVDPLADVGIKLTIQRVRLEGARAATGGSVEFEFFVGASAQPQRKTASVGPGGAEQTVNVQFTGNADDTASSRTSAPIQVVLGAKDASTKAALDLGIPSSITYDLAKPSETFTYDGADGTSRILVETVRT